MFNFFQKTPTHGIPEGRPLKVEYTSNDLDIPDDLLLRGSTAQDAQPMTMTPVDWKATAIPEYDGRFAIVLDNVLSQSECDQLIRLAETSVGMVRIGDNNKNSNDNTDMPQESWTPAMVNAGNGYEVLDTTYRKSDRIIWDNQEVVDRLWARCLEGDVGHALRQKLAVLEGQACQRVLGGYAGRPGTRGHRWEMRHLNRRMRFLRYGPGQFFKPHCDSYYAEQIDGKTLRTMFTVHFYLNDSVAEAGDGKATLVGGATSFLSSDDKRKVDVNPKAGRVLIFQHAGLNHSGDWVARGTKYTMRTEVMYEPTR